MHVYIDFVSISEVTSSCSVSLNVGIVICIVSSVSVRPVNKIAKKKKKKKKTAISEDTGLIRRPALYSTRQEVVSPTLAPVQRPQSRPPSDLTNVLARLGAEGDIVFAQTTSTLRNPELRRLASSLPT